MKKMPVYKSIVNTALSLLVLSFSLACASGPSKRELSSSGRIIEYVSPGQGFNTKTFFYEGETQVIAFDAQFTEEFAKDSIQYLRGFTSKPITWLVLTHPNPDKFNGAKVFQEVGAKVVASRATNSNLEPVHNYKKYYFVEMAKMFTSESYPRLPGIDVVFDDTFSIDLGGAKSIMLKEYNQAGVSLNQTVALLPDGEGLVVGDLVHNKAHAWLEGGIVESQAKPTLKSWIQVLNSLASDFDSDILVYGGRGKLSPLALAVSEQIAYLKVADKIVSEYIQSLGKNKSELKSEKASKHYKILSEIFEKEFPDYELSYMIQYGIYGLVNSKL